MFIVTLKRRTNALRIPEAPPEDIGGRRKVGGSVCQARRVGILFLVCGVLLLSLTVGEVLAGAAFGTEQADILRNSGFAETISGMEGDDLIYGSSGGDSISGGGGHDEVYGGAGRDVMFGGSGNDFIEAKDSEKDFVSCGAGLDVVSVDEEDLVSRDCETVYRA